MGKIVGKVQNGGGKPVADCPVAIVASSTTHLDIAAVTDAQGDFAFDNLAEGWYELRAYGTLSSRLVVKGKRAVSVVLKVSEEQVPDDLHQSVGSDD